MVKNLQGYIGLAEAGRITGFSLTRLRVLVDSGRLAAIKDPVGRRLVQKAAVLRLAERRTRIPGSAGGSVPRG